SEPVWVPATASSAIATARPLWIAVGSALSVPCMAALPSSIHDGLTFFQKAGQMVLNGHHRQLVGDGDATSATEWAVPSFELNESKIPMASFASARQACSSSSTSTVFPSIAINLPIGGQ